MAPKYRVPLILIIALAMPCVAPAAGTDYRLDPESTRHWGCHDPCLCPDNLLPVTGTFRLSYAGSDPLFDRYAITDIDWTVDAYGVIDHFGGTGEYRIGGEVAIQEQLVLDLEHNGIHHYDSGLVPGGSGFPRIQVVATAETVLCFHDVLSIAATPVATAGVPAAVEPAAIRLAPNPFHNGLTIEFRLLSAAPTSVSVLDLAGRRVRLLGSALMTAGPHSIAWDGRRDDGGPAPAGVYQILIRAPGVRARATAVRLE